MMRKILLTLIFTLMLSLSGQAFAFSTTTTVCQSGSNGAGGSSSVCQPSTTTFSGKNGLLKKIIDIFSIVAGIIAVFMLVIGGFMYVVSSGESQRINQAKNTIVYAIIGLVVVAIAQTIVFVVIDRI